MLLHGRGLAWSSLSWSWSQVLDNAANNFATLWFSMVVLLSLAWVEQQALGLPAWFPLRHLHIPLGLGETVVLDLLLMVEKMVVLSYNHLSNWKRWMQWFRTRWFAPPHGLPPSGPWSRHLPPPSGFSPRVGQWQLANHCGLTGGHPKPWPMFPLLVLGVPPWVVQVAPVLDQGIAMDLASHLQDLATHLLWRNHHGDPVAGSPPGELLPHCRLDQSMGHKGPWLLDGWISFGDPGGSNF